MKPCATLVSRSTRQRRGILQQMEMLDDDPFTLCDCGTDACGCGYCGPTSEFPPRDGQISTTTGTIIG